MSKAAVMVIENVENVSLLTHHQNDVKKDVSDVCTWVGMVITHHDGKHYLMLTDCGPTRFTIWQ